MKREKYLEKQKKEIAFRRFQRRVEKEQKKHEYEITYINIKENKWKRLKKGGFYTQTVYRGSKGRFVKKSDYILQQKRQAELKIIPETEKGGFYKRLGKTNLYRASVAINGIPIARQYYSATLVKIDSYENIDMDEMLKELLEKIERSVHYKQYSWWFDYNALKQEQSPTPYYGYEKKGVYYEFHKI